MANKGVVALTDYIFDASAKTITFSSGYINMALSDIMYIINVKSGVATVIYDPSDTTKGGSLTGLVLTLDFDTTSMGDSDSLQIIIGMSSLTTPISSDAIIGDTLNTNLKEMNVAFEKLLTTLNNPLWINGLSRTRVDVEAFTVGTLPTVTTVGTVSSVSNIAAIGNESANFVLIDIINNKWANTIKGRITGY